jgi:hypothetical protein
MSIRNSVSGIANRSIYGLLTGSGVLLAKGQKSTISINFRREYPVTRKISAENLNMLRPCEWAVNRFFWTIRLGVPHQCHKTAVAMRI